MIDQSVPKRLASGWKFIVFSALGLIFFFAPVPSDEGTTIPIELIATWISETFPTGVRIYALLAIMAGAVYPFVNKTWNKNSFERTFTVLKLGAVLVAILIFFNTGPEWLMAPDMGPFLFDVLIVSIGLIIPIAGTLLAFLIGYGLLEYLGVVTQRFMRPMWRVPGRASVNALASYIASLVVGLLITDREYKEGRYTLREAVIIATGFSTVTATFLVVVASVLGIMDVFFMYFIVTFIVTAIVTAVTVRIWPISKIPDTYAVADPQPEDVVTSNYFKTAWHEAVAAAAIAPSFAQVLWTNFRQALVMTMSVLPAILSVGLIGLVLVEYTPIFDWLSYVFLPLMHALQIPDPQLAAVAAPIGITEMLLPALVVVDADIVTRFVVGVFAVSQVVFFSTHVPAVLATDVPISVTKLCIIWFERTVLSFLIATPIAFILL